MRCFATAEEAIAWKAGIPTGFPVGSIERARWISEWAEMSRRCLKRYPELARFVSTEDTARDLDLLRQAVGDAQLSYYGVSYGTFLGATYANLFPGRVRALVLDGNVDPERIHEYRRRPSAAPQHRPAIWRGPDRGGNAGPVHPTLWSRADRALRVFRRKPDRDPAKVRSADGAPSAWRRGRLDLRQNRRCRGARALLPRRDGPRIAETLQALWERRAPAPPPAEGPPAYPGFEFEYAVVCSESPNPRRPARYEALEKFSYDRAGDLGRWWAWDYEPCATWAATAAHPYADRGTARPPVPSSWSIQPSIPPPRIRRRRRWPAMLANARLLTLEGYGHTALLNRSACVDRHVIRYLITGALPHRRSHLRARHTSVRIA